MSSNLYQECRQNIEKFNIEKSAPEIYEYIKPILIRGIKRETKSGELSYRINYKVPEACHLKLKCEEFNKCAADDDDFEGFTISADPYYKENMLMISITLDLDY